MSICKLLNFAGVALSLGLAPVASAISAEATTGHVSGQGTEIVKRAPDTLRMRLQLIVEGKDMNDALTKLKARRVAVKKAITDLGANKDSITSGNPRFSAQDPRGGQGQFAMPVAPQVFAAPQVAVDGVLTIAEAPAANEEAKPAFLSVDLTAEWPLKSADAEDLFITGHALEQKISAEMSKLRSVAQAAAPAAAPPPIMQFNGPVTTNGVPYNPEAPSFSYVARVSKEDVEKARGEAFQKARARAADISKAAGATLGPLEQLTSYESSSSVPNGPVSAYGTAYYMPYSNSSMITINNSASLDPAEATGNEPNEVTLSVVVQASFGLKESSRPN